jgi:GTP-binding protein
VGEVTEAGHRLLVARAGKGGRGNKHFTTSVHQAPKFAEGGTKGEEMEIRLELRLLADAALVGLPNAGKSTLLSRASAARPRIGDYPFTTLEPQLGIVEAGWERFVLADMPGLIAGAAEGAGLGQEFLRHIQRTSVLLHVVDGQSDDLLRDIRQVEEEMQSFDPVLLEKPRLLVVNKIDIPAVRERREEHRRALKALHLPVYFVSAETGEGVDELSRDTLEVVKQARAVPGTGANAPEFQVFRPGEERGYQVRRMGAKYVIEGTETPDLVVPRDISEWQYRSVLRERLRRTRWRRVLERAGVEPGDAVVVGGVEIEW